MILQKEVYLFPLFFCKLIKLQSVSPIHHILHERLLAAVLPQDRHASVADKANEITTIPELLSLLEAQGAVSTINGQPSTTVPAR